MTESIKTPQVMKSVEYSGGTANYEVVGDIQDNRHNPIVLVPGFGRGLIGYHSLGDNLHKQGGGGVIVVDQPKWSLVEKAKFGHLGGLSAVDHQAQALLAILREVGIDKRPVDFVAHSFGAVILERAAQLAHLKKTSITSFNSEIGSHSIFVAPAGTLSGDSARALKARFNESKKQSSTNGRRGNDSYMAINEEGARYQKASLKVLREFLTISKAKIQYRELGKYGLKPFVLEFPNDKVFPEEKVSSILAENADYITGYGMPISPSGTHDEVVFAPGATAKSILQILEH